MTNAIRDAFNSISTDYDRYRKKLIPCFDDFYNLAAAVLETTKDNPKVLDIGAGTGLMSAYVLHKLPDARLTLIDIADGMMELARQRFAGNPNVRYVIGDYSQYEFNEKYDFIVSALSIHHLEDEQKAEFYRKSFALLEQGGVFVNAEQILGETPTIHEHYLREWKKYILGNGFSEEEIARWGDRRNLDREATLASQLNWLRQAGFADVDCVYKYNNFAVFTGRKK